MKRLELLDYGRFCAALSVVLFHYTFNGIANGKISSIGHIPLVIEITKYGYLGVELFFMISGYVIFFSAKNRSAAQFAVGRVIRLYPAYWFAVLFTSFFALKWGGNLMSVYPTQIIVNFSMLQSFFGVGHVDGVYWTLVYEITFYAAVFLLLFCGLQSRLKSIFIFWPVLFCAALLLEKQSLPYLGGYYYYFAAGALFAILKEGFDWRAALGLLMVYALCLYFSAGVVVQLTGVKGAEYSPVVIGLTVTAFFLLFILQDTRRAQLLNLPMSGVAGALTYPMYLMHAHFGYMFINQFATEENKIVIYISTILIIMAVSFLIHEVIEVRFSYFWRNIFNLTVGRFVDFLQGCISRIQVAYNNRTN